MRWQTLGPGSSRFADAQNTWGAKDFIAGKIKPGISRAGSWTVCRLADAVRTYTVSTVSGQAICTNMVRAISSDAVCTNAVGTISGYAVCTNTVGTISSDTVCTNAVGTISGYAVCTNTVGTISSNAVCTNAVSTISGYAVCTNAVSTISSNAAHVGMGRTVFSNNRCVDLMVGINTWKCKCAACKNRESQAKDQFVSFHGSCSRSIS
jgi:hypothetical protein